MTWNPAYPAEPTNPPLQGPDFDAAVRRSFQGMGRVDTTPYSIPWSAIDVPLIDFLPVTPNDRAEVNLISGEGVVRMVYRRATNRWYQVGAPSVVTDFPGDPTLGDQVVISNGLSGVWTFQYVPTIDATYPWMFTGGSDLADQVDTSQNTASTSFTDLGTSGPTVTLPLAGVYDITVSAMHLNSAANNIDVMSYQIGATAATDTNGAFGVSTTNIFPTFSAQTRRLTIAAAATTVTSKYRTNAGTASFERRHIQASPVRVA